MYKIEDVLNVSHEPDVDYKTIRNAQRYFLDLSRSIARAVKESQYSEDEDLKGAIEEIESELNWCESEVTECIEALEEYMSLVDEWRSLVEERLDEDEKQEWIKYQVANQLIKANGNIK